MDKVWVMSLFSFESLCAALLINGIPFGLEDTKWSSEDGSLVVEAKDDQLYLNRQHYPMRVFFKVFAQDYSLVRAYGK